MPPTTAPTENTRAAHAAVITRIIPNLRGDSTAKDELRVLLVFDRRRSSRSPSGYQSIVTDRLRFASTSVVHRRKIASVLARARYINDAVAEQALRCHPY